MEDEKFNELISEIREAIEDHPLFKLSVAAIGRIFVVRQKFVRLGDKSAIKKVDELTEKLSTRLYDVLSEIEDVDSGEQIRSK